MGLFFSRPVTFTQATRPRLIAAHTSPAKGTQDAAAQADRDTSEIEQEARPAFSLLRFCCALVFVLALFGFYYLSAHDPTMSSHSDQLFNLFEILTTGLIGVLVGEASSK